MQMRMRAALGLIRCGEEHQAAHLALRFATKHAKQAMAQRSDAQGTAGAALLDVLPETAKTINAAPPKAIGSPGTRQVRRGAQDAGDSKLVLTKHHERLEQGQGLHSFPSGRGAERQDRIDIAP